MSRWKTCNSLQAVKRMDKAYKGLKRTTLLYSLGTSGNVPRDNRISEFYKRMEVSIKLPSLNGGKANLEQM